MERRAESAGRELRIRPQARKSLAMVVTGRGIEVRIPQQLDPAGERVQAFIATGLAKLEAAPLLAPRQSPGPHTPAEVRALVAEWADKLGVTVERVQIRPMIRKWGSISSRGNLTLAADVCWLPRPLLEYVVVHELLHRLFPHHARPFQVALELALPDRASRERQLAAWLIS